MTQRELHERVANIERLLEVTDEDGLGAADDALSCALAEVRSLMTFVVLQGNAWLGYTDGRLVAIELDPFHASKTIADWEARGYRIEVLPKAEGLARWRREVGGFAAGLVRATVNPEAQDALARAQAEIDYAALAWRQQRADEAADVRADT